MRMGPGPSAGAVREIGRIAAGLWIGGILQRSARDSRPKLPVHAPVYRAYRDHEKLQPLVGEVSWTKHLFILGKYADPLERWPSAPKSPPVLSSESPEGGAGVEPGV